MDDVEDIGADDVEDPGDDHAVHAVPSQVRRGGNRR